MNDTIVTLYNLLGINQKIPKLKTRLMYLKEVWGLDQIAIGEMEGISQSYVSQLILKGKETISNEKYIAATDIQWSAEEIQYLQMLPREIISDIGVIAFINDILGVDVIHPFFQHYDYAINWRIAALGSMGIQNKKLVQIFKKSQPAVSMIIKRSHVKANSIQRENRYHKSGDYRLSPQPYKRKFILAGGQF
jgi:hypothetical protein